MTGKRTRFRQFLHVELGIAKFGPVVDPKETTEIMKEIMKSPMVEQANYIESDDKSRYSELKVMQSAAGFYIGTEYDNPDGFKEPGSRDTGYFRTREEAEAELKRIESGESSTTRLTL